MTRPEVGARTPSRGGTNPLRVNDLRVTSKRARAQTARPRSTDLLVKYTHKLYAPSANHLAVC